MLPLKKNIYIGIGTICLLGYGLFAQSAEKSPGSSAQYFEQPLKALLQQALRAHPDIQAKQKALQRARTLQQGASLPLFNPQLLLDSEQTAVNTTSLEIAQTLDWNGQQQARTRLAEVDVKIAEQQLEQALQQKAAQILLALNQYNSAKKMYLLASRRSQIMKDFLSTLQQRRTAGDLSALDLALGKLAYNEALLQQAASKNEVDKALIELQQVSALITPQARQNWPAMPATLITPPARVEADLLQKLPLLKIASLKLEKAKKQIRLTAKAIKANPDIALRLGKDGQDGLIGISLQLPLLLRNNFRSEVDAAALQAQQQEAMMRNQYLTTRLLLQARLTSWQNQMKAWKNWQKSGAKAQTEQMSLLKQLWQAGELSASDYLIQAKQNLDTQIAASSLYSKLWEATLNWLEASGQTLQMLSLNKQNILGETP